MLTVASSRVSPVLVARAGYFGPTSPVECSRPTLDWHVWCNAAQVTSATMTVDGQAVAAKYDSNFRAILFTPDSAMAAGSHRVHCEVTFNGTYKVEKDWSTVIEEHASSDFPPPVASQQAALEYTNRIRAVLHLPLFTSDPRFHIAAQKHSDYMAANQVFGHEEAQGMKRFVGITSHDRLETYGWGGPYWEGLALGSTDAGEAIQEMFDAPYHRMPFLQPGTGFFGFGEADGRFTAEFSRNSVYAIVTSPADGEDDVPTQWFPHEHPDPLMFHPELQNKGALGYPIMLAEFNGGMGRLRIFGAHLEDDKGQEVPTVMNYSGDDPNLTEAMIIIPEAPLEKGKSYHVTVKGVGTNGKPLYCRWQFKTSAD